MSRISRLAMWDRPQRAAVAGLVILLSIGLGILCGRRPAVVGDPQPIDGPRASEILGRIDPNTASAGDLSAIPNLGEKRAKAIVAFREIFAKHHAGEVAFRSAQDLTQVEGIGAATAANIEPFVVFPARGKG